VPFLLALVALAALALALALRRSNELFCLDLRGKRLTLRRGRVPQRLLDDFADVLARSHARRAVIRAVTWDRVPRLDARGDITADELQQLRNVFGTYSLAKLRAGQRRK
jgi:hypothetical protein